MKKKYKTFTMHFIFFEKDIVCQSEIIVNGNDFYGGDDGWEEGT